MKIERELKYSTTEEHVPSLAELRQALGSSELEFTAMSIRRHVDSYFDDPEQSLQRAGWALRQRRSESVAGGSSRLETVVTLKSGAELSGALHSRREIEVPLTEPPELPASGWPTAIVTALPSEVDLSALRELVQLRVRRVIVPVVRRGATVAELSFDEVVCAVPGDAALEDTPRFTFHEVEIEALGDAHAFGGGDLPADHEVAPYDTGVLATLTAVAAAVRELLPLVESSSSKLERAIALLGPFLEDRFSDA